MDGGLARQGHWARARRAHGPWLHGLRALNIQVRNRDLAADPGRPMTYEVTGRLWRLHRFEATFGGFGPTPHGRAAVIWDRLA
jgi:hypothetical protein